MPDYNVLITRDATEHAVVRVQAAGPDEAEARALVKSRYLDQREWEVDEGNFHEPYLTDKGNCAEEVDELTTAGDVAEVCSRLPATAPLRLEMLDAPDNFSVRLDGIVAVLVDSEGLAPYLAIRVSILDDEDVSRDDN